MQNASGAMWAVHVEDAAAGADFEVGQMWFLDRPVGLLPEHCRTLQRGIYSFQEYYAGFKDFTTEASWSGAEFSNTMEPIEGVGYCKGPTLQRVKGRISLAR